MAGTLTDTGMSRRGDEAKIPAGEQPDPWSFNQGTLPASIPLQSLPTFAAMAGSDDAGTAFHGVLMIRKLLSVENDPPIQHVVDANVLPLLVRYLAFDEWPEMQLEAARAVSSIMRGTQAHKDLIVQLDAVSHFVRLLESEDEQQRALAATAVGEVAADSANRDWILGLGVEHGLMSAVNMASSSTAVLREAMSALSIICQVNPPPPMGCIVSILPAFVAHLDHPDSAVAISACWGISYICDGRMELVQRVVQTEISGKIAKLLSSDGVIPALRTIANMVYIHRQVIIESGALMAFHGLLHHRLRSVKMGSCRCLSNLCDGSPDGIQAVIAADLYPAIIKLVTALEDDVNREAVYCIANTTNHGTRLQLLHIIEKGVVEQLCHSLTLHNGNIGTVMRYTVLKLIEVGEEEKTAKGYDRNPVEDIIVGCGGVELIKNLRGKFAFDSNAAAC